MATKKKQVSKSAAARSRRRPQQQDANGTPASTPVPSVPRWGFRQHSPSRSRRRG